MWGGWGGGSTGAFDTGPIPTENQVPCQTPVACLLSDVVLNASPRQRRLGVVPDVRFVCAAGYTRDVDGRRGIRHRTLRG